MNALHIAVIPARKGSKRLPNKNIKLLCGKPLINWTIDAAIASKVFDLVLVTTDSAEIAALARCRRQRAFLSSGRTRHRHGLDQ